MKTFYKAALVFASMFLVAALAAQAATFNKRTIIKFSQPVEVPGTILAAGTYNFTIPADAGSRNVVQIWDASNTKLITTILAIPDYSIHTPQETIIRFHERPANAPQAVKAWFYPGFKNGVAFVYPMKQAKKIAKANNEDVPAEVGNPTAQDLKKAHVVAVTPSEREEPVSKAVQTSPSH